LKAGTFTPMPVRERSIPKPGGSGRVRRLGIATIADRVVQAALKLVLEPIFETDFMPVSYGFRPRRRAHDAIAEIQRFGTKGYRWVLDADIEACFDTISHPALMDRVRASVKDKRVLLLVKAFLKAGVLTESRQYEDSFTGTPQGGILSPLLATIALAELDEHVHRPWLAGGAMSTPRRRAWRRTKSRPNWRIVRYADDFVILVHGNRDDVQALHDDIATVLEPLGLKLSPAKTRIVHMSEGFNFLGFCIQWRRTRGTSKWYVYTFIADRPIRSLKQKVRDLTHRTSQQKPRDVLIQLNQIMRGWANYFRHAVCKHTLRSLETFIWRRVICWWKHLHRWNWKTSAAASPDHKAGGAGRRRTGSSCSTSHRCRSPATDTGAAKSPTPGSCPTTPNGRDRGEPVAEKPCAVSLGVGLPPQGAEVRKEVTSGPPVLPGRESARGPQHDGKARSIEKASKALPCKARVIWRRPDCLKPSHQRWKTHTLRHDA
jgi:RNA-directed DNA polymerase